MRYNKQMVVLTAAVAGICWGQLAHAEKLVVPVANTAMDKHSEVESTMGPHYVLELPVPSELEGHSVVVAFLELRANVTARAESVQVETPGSAADSVRVYLNEEPILEVFALTEDYGDGLAEAEFRDVSVSRDPVLVGTNRSIRIDVTEILTYYLDNPTENHGLVIGSLNGRRDGVFEVQTDAFGSGTTAVLTVYYDTVRSSH